MRRPLLNHTERGGLVYDPFLGWGSTLIAAEDTGRVCYSSAEPILKQSRRELPSTDPPTRAPDEALQISWACTALSRGARHPQCSFPPQTTFTFCRELSSRKASSIRDMAGDHRSLTSAWNTTPARRAVALSKLFKPIQRLSHRNVTVPTALQCDRWPLRIT